MVAQPASVPAARRFVDDVLTGWGRGDVVDDVGLCVTELTTNVALHSAGRFFEVELHPSADAVELSVLDVGVVNAATIVSQPAVTGPLDVWEADLTATTGRGLFIVSMLAASWGVEDTRDGTRVWARFAAGEPAGAPTAPHVSAVVDEDGAARPRDWVEVRLLDCPVALLLAHDDNVADMIRELQLVGVHRGDALPGRLAAQMEGVVRRHAVNWAAARVMARHALHSGRQHADVHVLAPPRPSDDLLALQEAMTEAERLSERGELITMPAGPDVQRVRDWMAAEFVRQAEQGREPVPYRAWLSARRAPA
jgi:anti-sigma regulatory factor (Ser/Thr protein kinase)